MNTNEILEIIAILNVVAGIIMFETVKYVIREMRDSFFSVKWGNLTNDQRNELLEQYSRLLNSDGQKYADRILRINARYYYRLNKRAIRER